MDEIDQTQVHRLPVQHLLLLLAGEGGVLQESEVMNLTRLPNLTCRDVLDYCVQSRADQPEGLQLVRAHQVIDACAQLIAQLLEPGGKSRRPSGSTNTDTRIADRARIR